MTEEKKFTQSGFRIKWADREIEYYGDSVTDIFKEVFNHLKSIPIMPSLPPSPTYVETGGQKGHALVIPATTAEGDYYDRISTDSGVKKEEVIKLIDFRTVTDFPEPVPFLPHHPDTRDAVRLVSYALQVGLQKKQIEVSGLKKVLLQIGYQLPGRELGNILDDFRTGDVIIASRVRVRNKPFSLSKKGLEQARELLKSKKT